MAVAATPKTLVIAETVPPRVQGPAIVLGNLLRGFPKGSFCILTKLPGRWKTDEATKLDCPHYFTGRAFFSARTWLLLRISALLEQLWIAVIVWKGLRVVRREGVSRIFAVSNEGDLLIAAYLVHKLTGLPLFVHMLDLYEEMVRVRERRIMAGIFEKRIFRSAAKVFVMSENLQEHYRLKYGMDTGFLRHPVRLHEYSGPAAGGAGEGVKTVVYTGNVWIPQIPPLRDMCEVVSSMDGVRFLIYTDYSPERLAASGITGRNVSIGFAKRSEIPAIQQNADVLFLPLAFESPFPLVMRTASPGKMPEYLAAGRPILVCAPPDAYISEHARKHGFGHVVDEPGAEALRAGLTFLLEDEEAGKRLVSRARGLAREHDVSVVSEHLQSALGYPRAGGEPKPDPAGGVGCRS